MLTYAHENCYFCRGYTRRAQHDAEINQQATGAHVGDTLHWVRYYKDTKDNA